MGRQGKLEERVDGDAAGVDGGHARGGHHDGALARALHQRLQKGGLARACLASEEDAVTGVLDKVPRQSQLVVSFHFFGVGW